MILVSKENGQEVTIEFTGVICGCRVNKDGKIEFRVKINNQKIWVSASNIFELPEEKDFKKENIINFQEVE